MADIKEIKLGVNIDHVATLRQARGTRYPEPVHAALAAESGGADLITAHLREDRRHIQARDIALLQDVVATRLNLEMALTPEMLDLACRLKPADCCLVPEKRAELTTEGGLDVAADPDRVGAACAKLHEAGVRVSLFIDPDDRQVEAARAAGAPVVELHTGAYANADGARLERELARLIEAARQAASLGLHVNAGHGLHYHNVRAVAAIPELEEFNIGHSIVARAVFTGMTAAVAEMKRLLQDGRRAAGGPG